MHPVPLLPRKDASHYLKEKWGIERSPKTLAKYATVGGGPRFRKDGKHALYAPDDLDAFAASTLSPLVKSTAELASLRCKGESS